MPLPSATTTESVRVYFISLVFSIANSHKHQKGTSTPPTKELVVHRFDQALATSRRLGTQPKAAAADGPADHRRPPCSPLDCIEPAASKVGIPLVRGLPCRTGAACFHSSADELFSPISCPIESGKVPIRGEYGEPFVDLPALDRNFSLTTGS
jgi:hypothetical protein